MNFITFLDNRQQEVLAQTREGDYRVLQDGEIQAIAFLLLFYRGLFKFLLIPKILIHFVLSNLFILKKPKPILTLAALQQKASEGKQSDYTKKLSKSFPKSPKEMQ